MAEPEIKAPKEDAEAKARAHFLADYDALCKNYGLMIVGEMVYGPQGIIVQPVLAKIKKDESGK